MPTEASKPIEILRQRRGPVPEELRRRVSECNRIQKAIAGSLQDGPKTAPEIATATGVPTDQVFWHLMAMRKYGEVVEDEPDGAYFRYALQKKGPR
jgi:predicted transcriptional regulator